MLFADWDSAIEQQSFIMDTILKRYGIDKKSRLLDCACGIGTQALGLAKLGYSIIGSDISQKEIERAKKEAKIRKINIAFFEADFCTLSAVFKTKFKAILAIDNALPHLTERSELEKALFSIFAQLEADGLFMASIRDYDEILMTKPATSPLHITDTLTGKKITFQLWHWNKDIYDFTQYILQDEDGTPLAAFKSSCRYRAVIRSELTNILDSVGFHKVEWIMPEDSQFYQPIVIAQK